MTPYCVPNHAKGNKMDDTQLSLKEPISVADVSNIAFRGLCPSASDSDTVGISSLTIYKNVVDNSKTYGLDENDLEYVREKLRNQNNFLEFSYVTNDQTGQSFSLKECIVSSNHSPQRYYGEIQNRINTLEKEAKDAGLTPIFLTMTLPSEFHEMKQINSTLIPNPKYNGTTPREAVKLLTKQWGKLRQDRSLKELTKDQRMYYRVNEPHKDGTPHTHILLFVPKDRIERITSSFKHLFNPVGNKIETNIRSATSYIMKYINKTLPMSKDQITLQDQYINAWYIKHRVHRFCSSRSTAPMYLFRMLSHRFSLYGLTQVRKTNGLTILERASDSKIMEIWDGEEPIYMRSQNLTLYTVSTIEKNLQKYGTFRGEAA